MFRCLSGPTNAGQHRIFVLPNQHTANPRQTITEEPLNLNPSETINPQPEALELAADNSMLSLPADERRWCTHPWHDAQLF